MAQGLKEHSLMAHGLMAHGLMANGLMAHGLMAHGLMACSISIKLRHSPFSGIMLNMVVFFVTVKILMVINFR
jgi:hypothetical protein